MKTNTLRPALLLLCFLACFTACKKGFDSQGNNTGTEPNPPSRTDSLPLIPYPVNFATRCPGTPSYGDSIFYLQPSPNDYIIAPINHPDSGSYFAWPAGMVIDRNTGAINLTRSEGGLRYNIGFVKKGSTDTCMQNITLAGVSYTDSIYALDKNQRFAMPYFNADPSIRSVCDPSGGPGGNTCEFDINGQAASQNIVIDHQRGIIDLKNTATRAFGLLPLNGATVTTTLGYKLNDKSSMTPQRITITFVYYNLKSDVPADLLNVVNSKSTMILGGQLLVNVPGLAGQAMLGGNPRPPIIIVTRFSL